MHSLRGLFFESYVEEGLRDSRLDLYCSCDYKAYRFSPVIEGSVTSQSEYQSLILPCAKEGRTVVVIVGQERNSGWLDVEMSS